MMTNFTFRHPFLISNLRKKPKGYVLVSVLVIMMIMLVITYYLADVLFSEIAISRNQKNAMITFNSAEAGIQEALWRVQNDNSPGGFRETFINSENGVKTFSHDPALLPNSSYTVTIQNTAKGAATITSTGLLTMGAKTAQRKTTLNIIQTSTIGPYAYDAALMVGGPNPGNIYLHNLNITHDAGYDFPNINGGGSIDIGNANIAAGNIWANQTIGVQNANVTTTGTQQQNYPTVFTMPSIDINGSGPNSYKSMAQAQGHYYTSAQFNTLMNTQKTFNGIVYVAGGGGVSIKNDSITFNGALVSEGSIEFKNATVNINHTTGPSGLLTLTNFNVVNANVKIEGLTYVGVLSASSNNANITITGALVAHDFSGNNINLKLNFKREWVDETLQGGTTTAPVIKLDHWEEEY